ncbi:hypothetical protein A374_08954 [Fictibacillus macauensis ZFHKF-1]|uniref:Uncharacterized protein n=1 Tax=Fictibacillus macauensis ZFHKF-1 TaxID=1196324 RepID=I8AJL7_9BACL|nr:hypothetical protein [Fictibacillus macauensis]EIT85952.1 hypothetical protein A374_08954 [Fictibacillus macauensis ZFHKF-1]
MREEVENQTVEPNGYGIKDPQEEEELYYCAGCGGEIYKNEEIWRVRNDVMHRSGECAELFIQDIAYAELAK